MKRNMLIFIAILLCVFCTCDLVNAQTDTTLCLELSPDSTLFNGNLKLQKKVQNVVDTFWVDGQSITIKCKNSSPDIVEKIISVVRASAKADAATVRQTVASPVVPVIEQPKKKEKYNPEIDLFLNIEDESVFSDAKFMRLDKLQVHPRSYKYYCLISNIYEFRKKIETAQNLGFQQVEQVRKLVDEMSVLTEQIMGDNFNFERLLLTQKQKDYYNKLYKKYEELWYFFNK